MAGIVPWQNIPKHSSQLIILRLLGYSNCKGKYFGQHFQFFLLLEPMPISSLFLHASTIEKFHNIFQMARSAKNFPFFLQKVGQNKASDDAKRRKFSIFYTTFDKIKPQMARSAENFSIFSMKLCEKH